MSLINELPRGFDTRVGDDGVRFSGGQRQRIALARAIYGEPSFVLLDEPNSSLDAEGEEALMKTLMSLKQRKCTTIVIAHRSTVLPAADKILVLRDGQVAAFGPRDEVMDRLRRGSSQPQALPASASKIAEGAA
jgi:ABC-type protease/lipase transport system fused ATPase/permease subunit